jgi:hypothetical protein
MLAEQLGPPGVDAAAHDLGGTCAVVQSQGVHVCEGEVLSMVCRWLCYAGSSYLMRAALSAFARAASLALRVQLVLQGRPIKILAVRLLPPLSAH